MLPKSLWECSEEEFKNTLEICKIHFAETKMLVYVKGFALTPVFKDCESPLEHDRAGSLLFEFIYPPALKFFRRKRYYNDLRDSYEDKGVDPAMQSCLAILRRMPDFNTDAEGYLKQRFRRWCSGFFHNIRKQTYRSARHSLIKLGETERQNDETAKERKEVINDLISEIYDTIDRIKKADPSKWEIIHRMVLDYQRGEKINAIAKKYRRDRATVWRYFEELGNLIRAQAQDAASVNAEDDSNGQ